MFIKIFLDEFIHSGMLPHWFQPIFIMRNTGAYLSWFFAVATARQCNPRLLAIRSSSTGTIVVGSVSGPSQRDVFVCQAGKNVFAYRVSAQWCSREERCRFGQLNGVSLRCIHVFVELIQRFDYGIFENSSIWSRGDGHRENTDFKNELHRFCVALAHITVPGEYSKHRHSLRCVWNATAAPTSEYDAGLNAWRQSAGWAGRDAWWPFR